MITHVVANEAFELELEARVEVALADDGRFVLEEADGRRWSEGPALIVPTWEALDQISPFGPRATSSALRSHPGYRGRRGAR